eukprot:CAMPEP_0198730148 /NCGR_PEP_ID=MMETSP1475-20131203/23058_1 /TAXON_ID= ORGANISM="Unidentified sp., Strain CCMP1999" /NCGR_SAMPLE_ID=MMETSP1475 /ASSEMBLY_ACC=CAM_ASM_001111 /LENGTH=136 /DNA_ID=CAMNT_0044492919 /DNA_START=713 /DNA_END=1123 /DNA_ORIENTATION=+
MSFSTGLKRTLVTESTPQSSFCIGCERFSSQSLTLAPDVANTGSIQWQSTLEYALEPRYSMCRAPVSMFQLRMALSSPHENIRSPSAETATPRTKEACAFSTHNASDRPARFHALTDPSADPEQMSLILRRDLAKQ